MLKRFKKQKGMILVFALVSLLILLSLSVWLAQESTIGVKITGAIKRTEQMRSLAEGAVQVAIKKLETTVPTDTETWTLSNQVTAKLVKKNITDPEQLQRLKDTFYRLGGEEIHGLSESSSIDFLFYTAYGIAKSGPTEKEIIAIIARPTN